MKDFIVYDNEKKDFITDPNDDRYINTLLDRNGKMVCNQYCVHEFGEDLEYYEEGRFTVYEHLLDDVEGNKIYADSSIVEFNLSTRQGELTFRGHYSSCESSLGYIIKPFDDSFLKKFGVLAFGNVWFNEINNIRIIDTIQENKLGLIR